MNIIRKIASTFGYVVIVALLISALAPKATRAVAAAFVQIVPGNTTHVGQYESQLVSLYCNETACYPLDANAALDIKTPYLVPTGYTLIVTDWEWTSTEILGGYAGNSLINANGGGYTESFAAANGLTTAFAHEHYASGIRVGSGVELQDLAAYDGFGIGHVQGYLVPND
jgi:hypothetical protein